MGLSCLMGPYDQADGGVGKYLGVITVPYGWMTFAFFQMLQAGAVMFAPTRGFLAELSGSPAFTWHTVVDMLHFREALEAADLDASPLCPASVESTFDARLLDFCYAYDPRHAELLVYYDSWEDLGAKVRSTDYAAHRAKVLHLMDIHTDHVLRRWRELLRPLPP
uniref:Uncharacterized protein n=1 Tax=Cryptomonas curvata TaxID=233186 RepID=A0A7S0QF19_9CRYP|mmetsp:Transcript_17079/g.36094  ORF Transcript_17079/g.36094 Transcript_17079/m.36094 type:complete len:165 (+) Transcript_17079:2-496(+)